MAMPRIGRLAPVGLRADARRSEQIDRVIL